MNEIKNFHQMLTWFLSEKSLYLDKEGPWSVDMISKSLGFSYRNLPKVTLNMKTTQIDIPKINKKEYSSKEAEYLKPVLDLKKFVNDNLRDKLINFLIHGSLATLDYSKGWSDLDTYLIVRSTVFEDSGEIINLRKKLLDASKYLYKIDPLQHHGFIFATEYDTKNYLSHCLPVEVLKKSKSLLNNSNLKIKEFRSADNTLDFLRKKNAFFKKCFDESAMFHHGLDHVYLLENYKEREAMYQMKYFLSVVMSMPAFFMDALGSPTYKDKSFEHAKSFFGEEWEIIQAASSIRNKWQFKEMHPFEGNYIPDWLIEELGKNYFERAYKLTNKMCQHFE